MIIYGAESCAEEYNIIRVAIAVEEVNEKIQLFCILIRLAIKQRPLFILTDREIFITFNNSKDEKVPANFYAKEEN